MKQCIIIVIFLHIYLFAQDTSSVYNQKLNQLRSYLGIIENAEFDSQVYNTLVDSLDSLGIKDEQLQDGFEWGGGKAGFEVYIKNNIDRLLSEFSLSLSGSDSLKNQQDSDSLMSQILVDTVKTSLKPVPIEEPIKPVEDLSLETDSPIKIEKKTKITSFIMGSNKIYSITLNGFLISTSAISGKVEFFKKIGGPNISPLAINNGKLYILTDKSKILVLN